MEPAGIEPASGSWSTEDPTCVVSRVDFGGAGLADRPCHFLASGFSRPTARRRGPPARFDFARRGTTGGVTPSNGLNELYRASSGSQSELRLVVGN